MSGRLIIQKFGGSSLGNPERILAVAERIAQSKALGNKLVIVVSAMGDSTDDLIGLARQITESPPHREMDMLLTVGERISMALLSMALAKQGVDAVSLTGSQTGIITDSRHRRARILRIQGDRVRQALDRGRAVIVAGFQGVSEDKEITTLGRGGSDTTAVALACTLGADACEIYTDVDGVFTADPRIEPSARLLSCIPAQLMTEYAVLGANVLHPRCVQLAARNQVALQVRNSMNDHPGTQIMTDEQSRNCGMEEFRIVGVALDREKALLTIDLMRPTVISSIWETAVDASHSVVAPVFQGNQVHFFTERDSAEDWTKRLNRLVTDGFIQRFRFDEDYVPLSLVGDRLTQDGTALSQVFDVLAKQGIQATLGSASSSSLTVAIPLTHADDAVRAVHARFLGGSGGEGADS